jgi:DNA-binding transcriptional MerR regulator/effector-binding domain-containing protein
MSMTTLVPIGDFSRMTHLSIKALRHYHDVGILEPARVDPSSGYRYYEPAQVTTAQVILRFRSLGMPLEDLRAVLDADDVETRNEVIVAHLQRMESQLEETQAMVASLRSILEHPVTTVSVEYRSVPETSALAIVERVTVEDLVGWWSGAFGELYATLEHAGITPAGPPGALYPNDLFQLEEGAVVAFVPLGVPADRIDTPGRARPFTVPAAELAVALHEGPFGELDTTYGALGTHVTERAIGVEGPIREYYVVSPFDTDDESAHRTEVCWPVFRTSAA